MKTLIVIISTIINSQVGPVGSQNIEVAITSDFESCRSIAHKLREVSVELEINKKLVKLERFGCMEVQDEDIPNAVKVMGDVNKYYK